MKKNFLFLYFLLLSSLLLAQNEYALINVYRPKIGLGSLTDCYVFINDVKICVLKNGASLKYKVFHTERHLKISVDYSLAGKPDKMVGNDSNTKIYIEKGGNYYFSIVYRGGGVFLTPVGNPLTKRLDENEIISRSDVEFEDESSIVSHPKTNWNRNSLIENWDKNGISDIEGIYEKIGKALKYELAVVKEKNEFSIIYLSGINVPFWQTGDLKATLQKTASFGLFKSNWYMLNKTQNKDVIVTFQKSTMSTIAESGNGQDIYIKTYPTYDENNLMGNAKSWTSSGTGFFIGKDGYVATCNHVVDEAKTIELDYLGASYTAEIILKDKQNDLAILRINDKKFVPLNALNYNFKTVLSEIGTSVFSLGYPLITLMGNEIKFTDGKINSKSGIQGDVTSYQISVPIQPGNSGGPLFDYDCNLVGITSSGFNRKLDLTENVNYAIKTKYLSLLIEELNNKIELPNSTVLRSKPLNEKISSLCNMVVLVKVK